jgi:hypothetical protein
MKFEIVGVKSNIPTFLICKMKLKLWGRTLLMNSMAFMPEQTNSKLLNTDRTYILTA